jgi:hypothetical protein
MLRSSTTVRTLVGVDILPNHWRFKPCPSATSVQRIKPDWTGIDLITTLERLEGTAIGILRRCSGICHISISRNAASSIGLGGDGILLLSRWKRESETFLWSDERDRDHEIESSKESFLDRLEARWLGKSNDEWILRTRRTIPCVSCSTRKVWISFSSRFFAPLECVFLSLIRSNGTRRRGYHS